MQVILVASAVDGAKALTINNVDEVHVAGERIVRPSSARVLVVV